MENNWKIESSITRIMLSTWIDCMVDRIYSGIVLEGNPPKEEIERVWLDLRHQYIDAIGDTDQKARFKLLAEIKMFEAEHNQAIIAIEVLSLLSNPDSFFPDEIREQITKWTEALNFLLTTNYEFNPSDLPTYHQNLENARARIKGIALNYELRKAQLRGFEKSKDKPGKEAFTREYFEDCLTSLVIHYKTDFKTDSISTYRYCTLINKLTRELSKSKSYARR